MYPKTRSRIPQSQGITPEQANIKWFSRMTACKNSETVGGFSGGRSDGEATSVGLFAPQSVFRMFC